MTRYGTSPPDARPAGPPTNSLGAGSGGAAGTHAARSAAAVLRTRTAPFHRDTEAAYAGFDLTDQHSYTLFLQAHLRAVTVAEQALAATPGLAAWQPRTPLLRHDLAELGAPVPARSSGTGVLDPGRGWGVLYVLEGSRLGSEILSRRVPHDLPHSYLGASHGPGQWRTFRAVLETALAIGGELMLEQAVAGATGCFTLFAAAARSPDQAGTLELSSSTHLPA